MTEPSFILHCIPTLTQGGAERVLTGLCGASHDRRHGIVTLFPGGEWFIPPAGVSVETVGMPRNIWGVMLLPLYLLRFVKLVRARKPDVVVGWLYYGALMASLARLAGRPVVWSIHAAKFDLATSFHWHTRMAIRLTGLLSRRVPTLVQFCDDSSRITHEQQLAFPPEKSRVIDNGINIQLFRQRYPAEAERPAGHIPVLAFVARVERPKDHATLFAAIRLLKDRGRVCLLRLAGRGADRNNPQLMQLIADAGVASMVEPLGQVSDMPAFHRDTDVMVLSLTGEAMPMSVLEAMASGALVVATDVGSCKEMVGPFGFIVTPRDPAALADAIESAAWMDQGAAESLRAWARHRVVTAYSLDASAASWSRLFDEIGGRKAAPASTLAVSA
jgi:glycosyltransferase involved in cell wall biosynthesis